MSSFYRLSHYNTLLYQPHFRYLATHHDNIASYCISSQSMSPFKFFFIKISKTFTLRSFFIHMCVFFISVFKFFYAIVANSFRMSYDLLQFITLIETSIACDFIENTLNCVPE